MEHQNTVCLEYRFIIWLKIGYLCLLFGIFAFEFIRPVQIILQGFPTRIFSAFLFVSVEFDFKK